MLVTMIAAVGCNIIVLINDYQYLDRNITAIYYPRWVPNDKATYCVPTYNKDQLKILFSFLKRNGFKSTILL